MTQSRKRRGRSSELAVAAWLKDHGFPYAEATSSSAPGVDILGTPGWAVEVKARRSLNLLAWLRQARRNAGSQQPVLIVRSDGQGTETVGEWAAIVPLADFVALWWNSEDES